MPDRAARWFRGISNNLFASACVALAGSTLVKLGERQRGRLTDPLDWPFWALGIGGLLLAYFGYRAAVLTWSRDTPAAAAAHPNTVGIVVTAFDGDADGAVRDRLIAALRQEIGSAIHFIDAGPPLSAPRSDILHDMGGDLMIGGRVTEGTLRMTMLLDRRRSASPDSVFDAGARLVVSLDAFAAEVPAVAARVLFLGAPAAFDVRRRVAPAMRRLLPRLETAATPNLTTRAKLLKEAAALHQSLGMQTDGMDAIERAADAYREALDACPREGDPVLWAEIQYGLGGTLLLMGGARHRTDLLHAAIAAEQAALDGFTEAGLPLRRAAAAYRIGDAQQTLGIQEGGVVALEQAVVAYHLALAEVDAERHPVLRSMLLNELGGALRVLGDRESGTISLEAAVTAFDEGLALMAKLDPPSTSSGMIGNQGATLTQIAQKRGDSVAAQQAVQRLMRAIELDDAAGETELAKFHRARLGDAEALVNRLAGR